MGEPEVVREGLVEPTALSADESVLANGFQDVGAVGRQD